MSDNLQAVFGTGRSASPWLRGSPWAGFAVLSLYTAATLALAAFLLVRRDA